MTATHSRRLQHFVPCAVANRHVGTIALTIVMRSRDRSFRETAVPEEVKERDDGMIQGEPRKQRPTTSAVLLAAIALISSTCLPLRVNAADATLPAPLASLESAGMALFDAAETSNWADAGQALERAKAAALQVDGLQRTFVDAGGEIDRYIEVQNNLGGDLIEANLALSTKDQRWLISSADRIDSLAGELAQPFLNRSDKPAARVDTLLYLARRMRRAMVWHDERGYRQASDDFTRVSQPLLGEPGSRTSAQFMELASALKRLGSVPSSADLKSLYAAVLKLREAPKAGTIEK